MQRESQNWYRYLWNHLRLSNIQDLGNFNVSVITFNYDVSFEQSLFFHLKNSFCALINEVAQAIGELPIYHVYGALASLDWQRNDGGRDYGSNDVSVDHVHQSSKSIRTTSETQKQVPDKISELMNNAEKIFFLGYGFAEENNSVLGFDWASNNVSMIATRYGLTNHEVQNIKDRTRSAIKFLPGVHQDCLELLRNYL